MDIKKLIEKNDAILTEKENSLIQEMNEKYDKAVKEAQKEFRYLEKLNPDVKVSSNQVQKILDKTVGKFSEEMNKLTESISSASRKSYEDALSETSQIVKKIKEK